MLPSTGFPPASQAEPHMGYYMSSPHHLSPLIVGSVVRAPLRHHAARAAASPHIRLDPRRSKPQSRMLAGAGLGGMEPFLGARRVSATVPLGHSSAPDPADQRRAAPRMGCTLVGSQAAFRGFSSAPVGTSPWVTNLQSATSSFRANATMAMRLIRPCPSRTRSRYQRLSALSG